MGISCQYASADCNLNGGCETNLASDANNCGSCGKVCNSGETCNAGKCEKPPIPPCNDADGDGHYSNAVACGAGAAKQDCNDADSSKWQLLSGYVDADGDGYTTGSSVSVCSGSSLLSGYVSSSLGSDCNDNNAAINPGAVDVCGNGVDENCFGGDATC